MEKSQISLICDEPNYADFLVSMWVIVFGMPLSETSWMVVREGTALDSVVASSITINNTIL